MSRKGQFKDITGERFGSLVALERIGQARNGQAIWACRCDCGNECNALIGKLRSGMKKSCGCLHKVSNQIYLVGDVGICIMRSGYFWFDAIDIDLVEHYHWSTHDQGYAYTHVGCRNNVITLRFTRLLMGLSADDARVVDHINGDVHDNRRCNLRICSHKENVCHRFDTRGYIKTPTGRYAARIEVDDKPIYIGTYDTEAEARAAYEAAAKLYFGDFGKREKRAIYYP